MNLLEVDANERWKVGIIKFYVSLENHFEYVDIECRRDNIST
jgi:hypothetical protein